MYLTAGTLLYSCPICNTAYDDYIGLFCIYRKRHILLRVIVHDDKSILNTELIVHSKYYNMFRSHPDNNRIEIKCISNDHPPLYSADIDHIEKIGNSIYCVSYHVYSISRETRYVYCTYLMQQITSKIDF